MTQIKALGKLVVSLGLASIVSAMNDWSTPCLQGICSYDVPKSDTSMAAKFIIYGSRISDITPAAGWEILNISSNGLTSDVRIVCSNEDLGCDHLFQSGPEGMIVRLPEHCQSGPFARVTKTETSADQFIPFHILPKIRKRDGKLPEVKTLSLDTNFTTHDDVQFAIVASSQSGVIDKVDMNLSRLTESISESRQISKRDIEKLVKFDSPPNNFNEDVTETMTTITINEEWAPFTQSPTEIFSIVQAEIQASYTLVAVGIISVVDLDNFSFTISVGSSTLNNEVGLEFFSSGTLPGSVDVVMEPISGRSLSPSLNIPGIISVTPTLSILSQVFGTIVDQVAVTADLNSQISSVQSVFSASGHQASANITTTGLFDLVSFESSTLPAETSVTVQVSTLLSFEINAFSGVQSVPIFLEFIDATTIGVTDIENSAGTQTCAVLTEQYTVNTGVDGSFFDFFDLSDNNIQIFSQNVAIGGRVSNPACI